MLSSRLLKYLLQISYISLVLGTFCATLLSCVALLSQAVRTAPNRSWNKNFNALIIGASYIVLLIASLFFCLKRTLAVRLKLSRLSRKHKTITRGDVPDSVHRFITEEYARTCLIAHQSQPTDAFHEGWGKLGGQHEGVYFRRALLDTIPKIDSLARLVIPTHPALKPHARMIHHFRFILPLLTSNEDELTPLHYYDSTIQLARISHREPTEEEFELGIQSAEAIMQVLNECRLEMFEDSLTQLNQFSEESIHIRS
ncbi:MAG: hypothetical protein NXY57DRAFT_1117506 [Lentinula lateritia]|uniref:Defect at low temperature protein 1 n=1 Tax=Lentinula lateritia TaxID=40482 RepID=A0ABQ8VHD6_9AGAR|nr:MAG: hypothetical protein NXY57DRAFT_1117506 [Lentinula lateritia]KAJ4494345.1 hypothetical protein C8R41DRAFT_763867 [Lentinula lateritia]